MSRSDKIDRAFSTQPQLKKRIFDAIDATPQYGPLFEDIATYHLTSLPLNGTAAGEEEPASKKRKLINGSHPVAPTLKDQPRQVILEARDISFSLPQRKKLHLGIAQYGTDINAPSTSFAIYTRSPATGEVDMEVPLDRFAYALRLPIPEKASKQYNFVLLPKPESQQTEPIIWTVNHGPLKSCQISSPDLANVAPGPDEVLENALEFVLKKNGVSLTLPTAEEFSSANPESHRKAEKAYHVKAFRGSKDGFLFFLHNGIFFGFKKPLAFYAFDDIESISYTSVLQRTFNLNIAYRPSGLSEGGNSGADASATDVVQEIEYSMLEQADFPGIDAYVKRHGLQDASLAESRRAKKLKAAANGTASTPGGDLAAGEADDGLTELERAQQQLEDEEDEEEEDYDPGSDDGSDGSASDDDDEYTQEFEKEKRRTKGKNLVLEELGSEAEDVSVTEDEGEEEGEGEDDMDEDEDGHDEHDEQDEDVHNPASVMAIPGPAEGYEEGQPDPYDEDQL